MIEDNINLFLEKSSELQNKIFKRVIKDEEKYFLAKKNNIIHKNTLIPYKDAQTEWWYFTGNLKSKNRVFGFELTIFKRKAETTRFGIIPLSILNKEDFYVVHFAVSDIANQKFYFYESNPFKTSADVSFSKLNIRINDFSIEFKDKFLIKARYNKISLEAELKPLKKLVGHGDKGYCVKVRNPLNVAYYLSFTRLKTKGSLTIDNKKFNVEGLSWFDHEKNYISANCPVKGWDWFSIILSDGTELMLYHLFDKKGKILDTSAGTYINKDNKIKKLSPKEFSIKKQAFWTSPSTKIKYPVKFRIEIPSLNLRLNISALMPNQEVNSIKSTIITYWEGLCEVKGKKRNKEVDGHAYVELVGYDNRLINKFLLHLVK